MNLDRTPEDIIREEEETQIMHEETDREWFPEEEEPALNLFDFIRSGFNQILRAKNNRNETDAQQPTSRT
jgi:hypothetical protein